MLANVTLNEAKRGIEIKFDCKPELAIITALKEYGFRWSGKQKLWYAKQSNERLSFAETIGTVSGTMNCNENNNYNLWDMTKTDGIENNYAKTKLHNEKEIAKIIRNHIKSRFPMGKWSVTSGRLNISVRLLSSPFAKESDELKAIEKYVVAFAESYNYNNSDLMSDYFDVNFYGSYSIPSWNYEQREATDEEIKISEMFAENKAEYDKAEELRKQKECEEYLKQEEIKKKEYEKREAKRKADEQMVENNHTIKNVNYTIKNMLLKANKDDNLDNTDHYDENPTRDTCKVSKEVHFSPDVYEVFERTLMSDYSFLDGMGGTYTDDKRIQSMADYSRMSETERQTVEWCNNKCVAIFSGDELKLVIDPQGYSYARYVYVMDSESEKVDNYNTDYGISEEEFESNTKLAEQIEEVSADIIIKNDIHNTWNGEAFTSYKDMMKEWIYKNDFKFNVGVVRAIKIEELKIAMYKLLTEVDSVAEQFARTDIEAGQKLTIVQINDFGCLSVSKVTFEDYIVDKYAQYDNAVRLTVKPENKRKLYYKWLYRDVLVYDGWLTVPEEVLYDVYVGDSGMVHKVSKMLSCDSGQYDKVLEYFANQGIKPLVNTYKPQF